MNSNRSTIKKGLVRLAITFAAALALVWIGSEVAFYFLRGDTDRTPQEIELVIPQGTAAKIEAGEPVPAIPDEMTFVLGDTLVVRNDDVIDHQLGPLWIPPETKASLVLDAAQRYAYSCSFKTTRYLGLNVKQATTWQTRVVGLGFAVPPTTMFFFIYSLVLWPLNPDPDKEPKVKLQTSEPDASS
jgi:hypothetical protein